MFLNFRDQSETFFVDFQTLWTLLTHLIFVTYKTLVIIIIPVPQIPKEMCLVRSYAYIVYAMRQLFFRFDFCSCICRHRSSRCLAWLLANFWQYIGNFCRQHRRPIARKSRPSYNCRMSSDNFFWPTTLLLISYYMTRLRLPTTLLFGILKWTKVTKERPTTLLLCILRSRVVKVLWCEMCQNCGAHFIQRLYFSLKKFLFKRGLLLFVWKHKKFISKTTFCWIKRVTKIRSFSSSHLTFISCFSSMKISSKINDCAACTSQFSCY